MVNLLRKYDYIPYYEIEQNPKNLQPAALTFFI